MSEIGRERQLNGIAVLIVEDDLTVRSELWQDLEFWGALVITTTGAGAFGAPLRSDVIVCGLATAEAAGPTFLESLRRLHDRPGRPVRVILLVPPGMDAAETAVAAGVELCLPTPVDPDRLRAAVGRFGR